MEDLKINHKEEETQPSSKKERRFLKRQQKKEEQLREGQKRNIKKILKFGLFALVIGGGIAGLIWFFASKPPIPEEDIVSKGGIHWHPELSISILSKRQEVPGGIGITIAEGSIHTHGADGVIHLQFNGLVEKDDIRVARFFKVWGKKFTKDCIFDKCSGPEGALKMFVNGEENFEFENYVMRDRERIEIIFE